MHLTGEMTKCSLSLPSQALALARSYSTSTIFNNIYAAIGPMGELEIVFFNVNKAKNKAKIVNK